MRVPAQNALGRRVGSACQHAAKYSREFSAVNGRDPCCVDPGKWATRKMTCKHVHDNRLYKAFQILNLFCFCAPRVRKRPFFAA